MLHFDIKSLGFLIRPKVQFLNFDVNSEYVTFTASHDTLDCVMVVSKDESTQRVWVFPPHSNLRTLFTFIDDVRKQPDPMTIDQMKQFILGVNSGNISGLELGGEPIHFHI